ncbi:MAG: DUF6377 domain-containing protein [Candidatus Azobacteroides sp.]|nr:DUF6377 domain-containing protein [Candidatus Azobacteroides sp.]
MKNTLFFTFILFCYIPMYANEKDSIINRLDEVMAEKELYVKKKEQRISGLKHLLSFPDLSLKELYNINQQLYLEYKKFKTDSAVHYILQNRKILLNSGNPELQYETDIQLAGLYSTKGMYIEAKNILDSINRTKLPPGLMSEYYWAYSIFYSQYGLSNNAQIYYLKSEIYRDSLFLFTDPLSMVYQIEYASKLLYDNKEEEAKKILENLLEKTEDSDPYRAAIAYFLGYTYKKQNNIELQKKYFSISAISDIITCTKDNASFQNLALTYYEQGDINKAYQFIQSAIEDAIFCNVRYRTIESSEFYPIINSAYQQKEKEQKDKFQRYLILISILSLALIIGIIYIYKQMKRLSVTRKELYKTNQDLINLNRDLQHSNNSLEEANLIKEEYIARFFDQCSMYIEKLESYRKGLHLKVKNNQLDDLFKMIRSTAFIENELEELYHHFDSVFLNIYPTFIEEFNALLLPDQKILPKPGELLNTELRIFALIRLGITDSGKIANFLRYSLRTVYNYRTKVRNKAAGVREEFEEQVKRIGSFNQYE